MALKGNREELVQDIGWWMNESAERGGIVSVSTVGSGSALDQSVQLCTYSATVPSGKHLPGLLLNDCVDIDTTRQHVNFHKNEMLKGKPVTLLQKGWATTDMIHYQATPAANSVAYVAESGLLHTVDNGNTVGKIGRFGSTKDEDGYAKVYIDLPN